MGTATSTPEQAFRASLSRRLVSWSLAVSLLPLAIVAVLADQRLGEALREGAFRRLSAVAGAQAESLTALVERRLDLVARIASKQELSLAVAAGKLGPTAQQAVDEAASAAGTRAVYVVSRDEKPIYPASVDLVERPELVKLLAKAGRDRGPTVSEWEAVPGGRAHRLYAAAPVIAEELFLGLVVVEIGPDEISAALAASAVEGGAETFVLAGGAAPVIVTPVTIRADATRLAASPLARRALTSERGQDVLLDHRGVALLTVWRQAPGLGTVVVKTDSRDTFAARRQLRTNVLVIAAITLVVAFAGARWMAMG